MMDLILSEGMQYSSFVEMLFANMFMTDFKNNEFWRYNQTKPIDCKLGDRIVSSKLSALLGLLFTPNARTIDNIDKISELDFDESKLTIYEKIFLEIF